MCHVVLCLTTVSDDRTGPDPSKQCWSTAYDADPTLSQHCFNVSCLLGTRSILFCCKSKKMSSHITEWSQNNNV